MREICTSGSTRGLRLNRRPTLQMQIRGSLVPTIANEWKPIGWLHPLPAKHATQQARGEAA